MGSILGSEIKKRNKDVNTSFAGCCVKTNKMLRYPSDSVWSDDNKLVCKCHNLELRTVLLNDLLVMRDDGWYFWLSYE